MGEVEGTPSDTAEEAEPAAVESTPEEPLPADSDAPPANASEATDEPDSEETVTEEEASVAEQVATPVEKVPLPEPPEGGWDVYVVPIEGPINSPQLYILRRALKEAIENDVEVVILDMDTPGGELGVTLEMMEALDNFEGETITFVNSEAISAGSYIAIATNDIYFSPRGIMGAAEAVTGTGENINESMQRKISSYLRAKVRVLSKTHRYRGDVQRAMMDPDYVLEIDGEVLKEEGELLSVTADEAVALYGNPPQPLLASGIADSVEDLLAHKYGEGNTNIRTFEVTWSEELAKWFKGIVPLLMGVGVILLFIEMKTPSFGVVGGIGIGLILLVFASNYFAGMAGHMEVVVFIIGVLLVVAEVFLFPGTLVAGLVGALMMAGALLWAMADIWPTSEGGYKVDWSSVEKGVQNLLIAGAIALAGMAVLWRFLKGSGLYRHVVSEGHSGEVDPVSVAGGKSQAGATLPDLGTKGVAITNLRPTGMVEIDGYRFEATATAGQIDQGSKIVVVGRASFSLKVEASN
ncbi:NfeD family protein [Rubellicoccus peritrichatus]|uniref:NfeD family protein n=1 Tax=Rubellicoccus peritrichatus TaxID=3080537 RepID=A0AAQ3LI22_9BACT|nr:NfeD family protein [Puniceicoccus sp. CR14]WOO42469.1 NfeD family protein [Puniceicoccus sp. CR14]